jgi:hypothetical protein
MQLKEQNTRTDIQAFSFIGIPLGSLGIIHGTQLNGVGFTTLLPMDENSATLTITGRTVENGDTIDLSSDFDFSVHAKIMDIRLFEGEQEISLTDPVGSASMGGVNYGGLGFIRYYHFTSNGMTIQNAGNVDIDIHVLEMDPLNGTITGDARIQLGNDGKGYFAILNYEE